ncbi:MAG: BrnT family toxin [Betaproteobacteria bacterium]|nr:BrnT family toxin [Betaproteobacteria bacterium]
MSNLRFEWDPLKATLNQRKHGVSFDEAKTVFADDLARLIDDPDHADNEERFILLGLSCRLRVLIVVHCYRANGSTIRIISARKATRVEQRYYP